MTVFTGFLFPQVNMGVRTMKVVALNGSARKDGNTAILVNALFRELKKGGIETELVQLAGKKIPGCIACMKCFEKKNRQCAIKGDIVNECIEKMAKSDGIVLASPTYYADISAGMKALIERAGFVARANDDLFRRRSGHRWSRSGGAGPSTRSTR
jgi:multimeric flavodoxin WrbA